MMLLLVCRQPLIWWLRASSNCQTTDAKDRSGAYRNFGTMSSLLPSGLAHRTIGVCNESLHNFLRARPSSAFPVPRRRIRPGDGVVSGLQTCVCTSLVHTVDGQLDGQVGPMVTQLPLLSWSFLRPRKDSNLRTRFRKPLLYPLSYGSWVALPYVRPPKKKLPGEGRVSRPPPASVGAAPSASGESSA